MGNNERNQKEEKKERKKPGIWQWIWAVLACVCCILFVIWTGYYAVLILIPVFIDIYITKFVPWGAWKQSENPTIKRVLDWVDAIVFALVGVYFITTFFFQNYQIPTSSLEKSLLVGDFLCVNKMIYGARSPMTPLSFPLMQHTVPVLGTKSYLEKPQLEYKRFAGIRSVERYDIVVFNYPSGDTVATKMQNADYYDLCLSLGHDVVNSDKAQFGDIIYRPVDRRENYVKRCVGLPGETIQLRNDTVFINGKALPHPKMMQLMYCVQTDGTEISRKVFEDLGISKDDQDVMSVQKVNEIQQDSIKLALLGLEYNPDPNKLGLLYVNVNMTADMVTKLSQKPFVKKIIRRNEYYKRYAEYKPMVMNSVTQRAYPGTYHKNIPYGDFPALWIPKKGETITFDEDIEYKVAAYGRCIKNYEFNDFEYKDGKVYINGQEANSYTFKYDYYFMMGDNRDMSADSRMWGFVPEDHIVGQPMFIWLSYNKDNSSIRWDRIFTKGNKNS